MITGKRLIDSLSLENVVNNFIALLIFALLAAVVVLTFYAGRYTNQIDANDSSIVRLERSVDSLRSEMVGFRSEMDGFRSQMDGFREEMDGFREEMAGFRSEMDDFRTEMREEIQRLSDLIREAVKD